MNLTMIQTNAVIRRVRKELGGAASGFVKVDCPVCNRGTILSFASKEGYVASACYTSPNMFEVGSERTAGCVGDEKHLQLIHV